MDQSVSKPHSVSPLTIAAFGLVALAILCAQIVLSRLFAGTLTYYFAFMLVSLAMLGLGSGSLIVQLASNYFVYERLGVQAARLSMLMGFSGFAGTLAMLIVYPRLTVDNGFLVLGSTFWCFLPFFLCGGTVVSLVLCHAREQFHRVYAVDLTAAALGCMVAIGVLNLLTPVQAMLMIVAVLPIGAGSMFAAAADKRRLARSAFTFAGVMLVSGALLTSVPRIAKPPSLAHVNTQVVHSVWDAQSAVHVYPSSFFTWSLSHTYEGPTYPMLSMLIDGIGGTQIVEFDGKPESLERYEYLDYDLTALPQELIAPEGRQLVIGPGAGVDLLQGVRYGRTDITAVEINPLVARVVNEDLADFSGSPYRLPGVQVHIDNARTFIKRSREQWDLISLTWVDAGGSATALAASENYLYTVEAYQEFIERLTPNGANGVLAFMRALGYQEEMRIDSMRGVAVAVEALAGLGIEDVEDHIIVGATLSRYFGRAMCLVMVKPTPFTAAETSHAAEFFARLEFQPIWLPGGGPGEDAIPEPYAMYASTMRETITTADRPRLYRESPYDIEAPTDDAPFYFVERAGLNREAGVGVRQLQSYLWILLVVLIPFLGLPVIPLARRTGPIDGPGIAALAYFCLLGLAFMLVEIEMFHVFALVLGNPTLALAVVLSGLLIFSGIGSLAGKRLAESAPAALAVAFAGLVALLLGFLAFREQVLSSLVVLSLPLRVIGTLLVIAPMALGMGLPMSTGMRLVRHRPDIVLWGWALNGTCSVLASVLAIYLAIHLGVPATFSVGAASYALAGVLIQVFRLRAVTATPQLSSLPKAA